MISKLVLNGLQPLCLLLNRYQCIFPWKSLYSVYLLLEDFLILYVRCLKGGVNPLGNCQFQVSLCNTKC